MAQKSKRNLAADSSFRKNYDSLHSALAPPNVASGLASKLYERAIITAETRDAVQLTSCITPFDRAATLLQAVESSIKMDHHRLRRFIRILRANCTLKPTALRLQQCYRTLLTEAGQLESCSSESDTDLEGTEQDAEGKSITVAVAQQIKEFESRFEDLTYDAQIEISEKYTPLLKFRHTVMLLPLSIRADHHRFLKENLLNIKKAESIDEIFMYLNLYWSFIDYHLLEHIIRKHGSDNLNAKMEEYVEDLAGFKRTTTISQICGLAKQWCSRPDLPQQFALLSTKFNKDPSEYTLEELAHFRVSFCREFSLSESMAMFAGAIKGSLIIYWHIPSSLVPDLAAAILRHPDSNNFFEQQSMLLLEIDGNCVYRSPACTSAFKEEASKDTLVSETASCRSESETEQSDHHTEASVGTPTEQSSLPSEIPPLDEDEEALLKACEDGNLEEVIRLIELGANVNAFRPSDDDPDTPLMAASWKGDLKILRCLLKSGALVNFQDLHNFTALIWASTKGHHDVMEELLASGADINVQTKDGATALVLASQDGHSSSVQALLNAGADPNIQTSNGDTALLHAANEGDAPTVLILLAAGADPNIQNVKGSTALTYACQNGHDSIVNQLLEKGADPNLQTEEGDTALILASWSGHPSAVRELLKAGADPNIQAKDGLTPLLVAIQRHHTEVVTVLLDDGTDINFAEKVTGWTALFFAAKEGQIEIIQLLLQKGADLKIVDKENLTAVDVAQAHSQEEVHQTFLDYLQVQRSESVELQTEEPSVGDTSKPPEGDHRQQVLKERVSRASNFLKTLFRRLEENLLASKTTKARAIGELSTVYSPQSKPSKRAKKQKRHSGKKASNTGGVKTQ